MIIYAGLILIGTMLFVAGIGLVFRTLFKGKNRHSFISDLRKEIQSGLDGVKVGKETFSDALDKNRIFKNELRNNMALILSENEKLKSRLRQNELTIDDFRKKLGLIIKETDILKEKLNRYLKEADKQKSDIQSNLNEQYNQIEAVQKELQEIKVRIIDFASGPGDMKIWEGEMERAKTELSDIKNKISEHRKISQDIKRQIAEITEGFPHLEEAAGDIGKNAESK